MKWTWQLPDWPRFIYDPKKVYDLEKKFLYQCGGSFVLIKSLEEGQKKQFIVEILCREGQKNAEIEGELLERASLQSSIQRHFGLQAEGKVLAKEQGMADLLWEAVQTYKQPLTHDMLFHWHKMLMKGEQGISDIGKYRSHDDPMQIISNRLDQKNVFYEAPPSVNVHREMTRFIQWFNESEKESVLVRAAVAHIYFECIHPFEDGNGRIGRILVEKALSQSTGEPIFIAISQGIAKRKKDYYAALALCNTSLNIQDWIAFFSEVIVQAQEETFSLVQFLLKKSKLLSDLKGKLNERQEKALLRMFKEGIEGFAGGLSAEKYLKITKTSRATATRDLQDLVEKGALVKTGELKHTRYWLNIQ